MKIYELVLDEETDGVHMIALVDEPAIKRNFIAFNSDGEPPKFEFKVQDEEKRIVMGPVMVANLPIYRYNEDMGDHYVVFRPNVIEQAVLRFFKERRNDQANIMHDGVKVDGVYLYESFIIDDRKPTPVGFDKLPNGSWFATFKVENDDVWERVKKGEFAGFSIEGFFGYAPNEKEKSDDLLAKILSVLEP